MNAAGKDPCEVAEIVYAKPLSGLFEEKLFGSDSGNTLWIKFSDKYGAVEWIGKFGTGESASTRVEKVCEPDKFLVSAGGFGYVVDSTSRQILDQCPRHITDGSFVSDIVYDLQNRRFVVASDTGLHFIEGGKIVWSSKRFAVDWIRDLKINGRLITGLGIFDHEGPETKFTFDLDTRRAKHGLLWRQL